MRQLIRSNQALDVNLEELYIAFMKALDIEVDINVIFLPFLGGGGGYKDTSRSIECECDITNFTIMEHQKS